jgi:hypothetical protein
MRPIDGFLRTLFITSKAVAELDRHDE